MKKARNNRGFTLLEMIIVIAAILIISGAALAGMKTLVSMSNNKAQKVAEHNGKYNDANADVSLMLEADYDTIKTWKSPDDDEEESASPYDGIDTPDGGSSGIGTPDGDETTDPADDPDPEPDPEGEDPEVLPPDPGDAEGGETGGSGGTVPDEGGSDPVTNGSAGAGVTYNGTMAEPNTAQTGVCGINDLGGGITRVTVSAGWSSQLDLDFQKVGNDYKLHIGSFDNQWIIGGFPGLEYDWSTKNVDYDLGPYQLNWFTQQYGIEFD